MISFTTKGTDMPAIFRIHRMKRNQETGKMEAEYDQDGNPVMQPKWRVVLCNHRGMRQMFTLTTNKAQSQRQADMLEQLKNIFRNIATTCPGISDIFLFIKRLCYI